MRSALLFSAVVGILSLTLAAPDAASSDVSTYNHQTTSATKTYPVTSKYSSYTSHRPSPTPYDHDDWNCTEHCGGICGDKIVQHPQEECDLGFGPNGNGAPGSGCTWDCKICGRCGDGYKDPGEECDAGAQNGKYGSGCSDECTICGYCGDGVVDYSQGEQCDYGHKYNGQPGVACDANCKWCAGQTPTTTAWASATHHY
jgi:hypothetical protein